MRAARRERLNSHPVFWIALSCALSASAHAIGLLLARIGGASAYIDEPLHAFVETAGSVTGLTVAVFLLLMDRVGRGATGNAPLVCGLAAMAVLDSAHAVVPAGDTSVWLHAVATFSGGLLFALVWVAPKGRAAYLIGGVLATALVVASLLLPLIEQAAARTLVDGRPSLFAVLLTVAGGVLVIAAATRYLWFYAQRANTDDLLFAVHLLLIGGAALLSDQSAPWGLSWWWWHALRVVAYAVALSFVVRAVMQLQLDVQREALNAQTRYQKARDEALEAANERHLLRRALDKHTLFSVTDRSGKIIDVNDGFCRISGFSRDELIGQNHRLINSGIHPRSFWIEVWRTIASGNPWRGEVCNRAKDGSLYWVDSTIVPWIGADGRPERYISLRFDITEAKRIAQDREALIERIADQERLLKTVLNSVSDGIVAEDADGGFLLFNRAAGEMLLESPDGAAPDNWTEVLKQYADDGETPLAPDELPGRRAMRGESVVNQELVIRRADGDRQVSCNATLMTSDAHRGAVVSLRDVTEVERMRRRLEQAQKLESIGQLAAGVAHEINTPIQFILSNAEFLKEAAPRLDTLFGQLRERFRDDDEALTQIDDHFADSRYENLQRQIVEAVDDSVIGAKRVIEIVRAMKEFSHPGDRDLRMGCLNDVAKSAATVSKNHWKYVAELELDLDADLPSAPCRLAEINQVLLNLIINAADAITEGRAGRDDAVSGRITLRTRHDEESVMLECEDNGPGIPEKVVRRIFDPFFTTKEVGKGSGQGLAISHDIVAVKHGGSIEVDSTPGEGTKFTVRLPLTAPDPKSEASATVTEAPETPEAGVLSM